MKKRLSIEFNIGNCVFKNKDNENFIQQIDVLNSIKENMNYLKEFEFLVDTLFNFQNNYFMSIIIKKDDFENIIVIDITKDIFDYLFYSKNINFDFEVYHKDITIIFEIVDN